MPTMTEKKLAKLESRIEDNIKKAWYENGLCLFEIHEDKLYKDSYSSFEDYLRMRWGYSRRQGYRLIDSSVVAQLIEQKSVSKTPLFGHKIEPPKESHIRELLKLEQKDKPIELARGQMVHVWDEVAQSDQRVTAVKVKEAVEEFERAPIDVKPIKVSTKKINVTSTKREVLYAAGNNDECYTPDYAAKAIIPHLDEREIVWCPFDKADSQFVIQLRTAGFKVVHSHIDDGKDFFSYQPRKWDVIVSNPPFTNKRQIFERALSFGKPFALIMSNTWLNDSAPKQLFKDRGLQLLMFEERMKFLNQDHSIHKITFSSSYFCCDFWEGRDVLFDSLKNYGY